MISLCCPTDKENGSITLPYPPMAGHWLRGTTMGQSGFEILKQAECGQHYEAINFPSD